MATSASVQENLSLASSDSLSSSPTPKGKRRRMYLKVAKQTFRYESSDNNRKNYKSFTPGDVLCLYSSHDTDVVPTYVRIQRQEITILLEMSCMFATCQLDSPSLNEIEEKRWNFFSDCCETMLSGLRIKDTVSTQCTGYSKEKEKEISLECMRNEQKECGRTIRVISTTVATLYKTYMKGFSVGDGRHALTMLLSCCKYILGIPNFQFNVCNVGGGSRNSSYSTAVLKLVSSQDLTESVHQEIMTKEKLPYKAYVPDIVLESVEDSNLFNIGSFYLYGEINSGSNEIIMYNQLLHQMLGGLNNKDVIHGIAISPSHFILCKIEICGDGKLYQSKSSFNLNVKAEDSNYKLDIETFLQIVKHLLKIIQDNHEATPDEDEVKPDGQ